MKRCSLYEIEWVDTIGYHGWYDPKDIKDIVDGYIIKTIGYQVGRTKDFLVVAGSYEFQSGNFGNLTYIPIKTIRKSRRIK